MNRIQTRLLLIPMMACMADVHAADAPVYVATAESREISPTREFPGRVMSDSYISLSSEVDGRVTWIQPLGQLVDAGDVVARIDDSLVRIARDKADTTVEDYTARLALAEKRRKRVDELSRSRHVSENQLDLLDAEITELQGLLERARLEQANQAERLRRTELHAPIAGRITERLVRPGEWVDQSDVVLRMLNETDLEVAIQVTSEFAATVNVGDPVSISSGVGIVGGELRIKAVQPGFEFYELRVDFSETSLPAGMPVNVGFPMQGFRTTQTVVPADALQVRAGKVGLFRIDEGGTAVYVAVSPLAVDDGWAAVEGEVAPGDTVVVRGVERLSNGQTVRILKPEVDLVAQEEQ